MNGTVGGGAAGTVESGLLIRPKHRTLPQNENNKKSKTKLSMIPACRRETKGQGPWESSGRAIAAAKVESLMLPRRINRKKRNALVHTRRVKT